MIREFLKEALQRYVHSVGMPEYLRSMQLAFAHQIEDALATQRRQSDRPRSTALVDVLVIGERARRAPSEPALSDREAHVLRTTVAKRDVVWVPPSGSGFNVDVELRTECPIEHLCVIVFADPRLQVTRVGIGHTGYSQGGSIAYAPMWAPGERLAVSLSSAPTVL